MHLGKTAPSVWLEAGKDDVEVLLCRTNCRGRVFAPTLLSQPFLELYGENIWAAVSVCISVAKSLNNRCNQTRAWVSYRSPALTCLGACFFIGSFDFFFFLSLILNACTAVTS